jgi:hypothetical protein
MHDISYNHPLKVPPQYPPISPPVIPPIHHAITSRENTLHNTPFHKYTVR